MRSGDQPLAAQTRRGLEPDTCTAAKHRRVRLAPTLPTDHGLSPGCVVCGDFTTNASTRGGKCLYCHDNPGQMVRGKPKALAKYQDAEEKKEAEASKLQLACAETPLSLDIVTLQTAYDSAKVGPPTCPPPPCPPPPCPPIRPSMFSPIDPPTHPPAHHPHASLRSHPHAARCHPLPSPPHY